MQYREAKSPSNKSKVLHHLQVQKAEEGGHVVEHHYENDGMTFHKPKTYVFGADEGPDMMQHIAKHMNVGGPKDGIGDDEGGERAPEREIKGEEEMQER